jgi:hypothetical protein
MNCQLFRFYVSGNLTLSYQHPVLLGMYIYTLLNGSGLCMMQITVCKVGVGGGGRGERRRGNGRGVKINDKNR